MPIPAGYPLPVGRRIRDVLLAAVLLVLTAPVLALAALTIKLADRGPVLYRQRRVGEQGRDFDLLKLRTMVVDAERQGAGFAVNAGDPRITPIGRALRRLSLDELPQLWNVLAGDMNIVGPRPERPTIFAELRVAIPNYHLRQRVRPGITGWAQINQAYDTCVDDVRRKIEFDLEYLRTRSVTKDISIMARTVPIMVSGKMGW